MLRLAIGFLALSSGTSTKIAEQPQGPIGYADSYPSYGNEAYGPQYGSNEDYDYELGDDLSLETVDSNSLMVTDGQILAASDENGVNFFDVSDRNNVTFLSTVNVSDPTIDMAPKSHNRRLTAKSLKRRLLAFTQKPTKRPTKRPTTRMPSRRPTTNQPTSKPQG